jgi:hypothetical protein
MHHNHNKCRQTQVSSSGCQQFYFMVKALTIYMLWLYKSPLHNDILQCIVYAMLLLLNTYLILTIGKNPGYAKSNEEE